MARFKKLIHTAFIVVFLIAVSCSDDSDPDQNPNQPPPPPGGNVTVTDVGGGNMFWGEELIITGTGFSTVKEENIVRLTGVFPTQTFCNLNYTSESGGAMGLNRFLQVNDSSSNSSGAKATPIRQTGFIAQEVEALVKKSGYVFSGVDTPENENDPYGIHYSEFVVPLVKAVQESSAEVRDQRQQIQSLLAQVDSKNGATANSQAVLLQNNPNPFDAETVIKMTLPDNVSMTSVMIYNLEGKQMKSIQVANRGDVTLKVHNVKKHTQAVTCKQIADRV